jgi:hypothetical protein
MLIEIQQQQQELNRQINVLVEQIQCPVSDVAHRPAGGEGETENDHDVSATITPKSQPKKQHHHHHHPYARGDGAANVSSAIIAEGHQARKKHKGRGVWVDSKPPTIQDPSKWTFMTPR